MAPARCPVCNDIITIGISVKLNQALICPTCLANLQVVSLNPLELELPERPGSLNKRGSGRVGSKKNHKGKTAKLFDRSRLEGFEDLEDEYDDLDDYTLERQLRHKPEREKFRKETPRDQ